MRTEYQISGSTPVTSRENGALHKMVTELALLVTIKSPTADSGPGCNLYPFSVETVDYNHILRTNILLVCPVACACKKKILVNENAFKNTQQ